MFGTQTDKVTPEHSLKNGGKESLESDSKIIGVVCATFGDTNTKRVLDFSSIKQKNIDFFSQFSCYYQVLDFYKAFEDLPVNEDDEALNEAYYDALIARFEQQLQSSGSQKYDVIFLWDLLNYLDVMQATKLFAMLKPYCHWKTHVYCMVNMNSVVPKSPMCCYVVDHNTLGYDFPVLETALMKNTGYFKQGLSRVSTGYALQHSSLLKSGIQEMLFDLQRET